MQTSQMDQRGCHELMTLPATARYLRVSLADAVVGVCGGQLPVVWRGALPYVDRGALVRRLNPYDAREGGGPR